MNSFRQAPFAKEFLEKRKAQEEQAKISRLEDFPKTAEESLRKAQPQPHNPFSNPYKEKSKETDGWNASVAVDNSAHGDKSLFNVHNDDKTVNISCYAYDEEAAIEKGKEVFRKNYKDLQSPFERGHMNRFK